VPTPARGRRIGHRHRCAPPPREGGGACARARPGRGPSLRMRFTPRRRVGRAELHQAARRLRSAPARPGADEAAHARRALYLGLEPPRIPHLPCPRRQSADAWSRPASHRSGVCVAGGAPFRGGASAPCPGRARAGGARRAWSNAPPGRRRRGQARRQSAGAAPRTSTPLHSVVWPACLCIQFTRSDGCNCADMLNCVAMVFSRLQENVGEPMKV
jgi:hypothetical protein